MNIFKKTQNINNIFTAPKNTFITKINHVLLYLQLHKLEISLAIKNINLLQTKNLIHLDGLIGDRKCQIRTSMILDIINSEFKDKLNNEKEKLIIIANKIDVLINQINTSTDQEKKLLIKNLSSTTSMNDYFLLEKIYINLNTELQFTNLCFIASLQKQDLLNLTNELISLSKIKRILHHIIKPLLCTLTIEYEQQLAHTYCTNEIQQALQQIEKKGFCSMTAFFPSIKPILEKIKKQKQFFIKKTTYFCVCGGIKNSNHQLFMYDKTEFKEYPLITITQTIPTMVIYGFQFPGSFEKLKETLHIPPEEISIPKSYHKPCHCNAPFTKPIIENIEEAILSNAAHHSQFTTEVEIDWQGLGLVNSDLHKEYEYLKTLSGFSTSDMSKFCINHIYPATIKEALEQDSPSIMTM